MIWDTTDNIIENSSKILNIHKERLTIKKHYNNEEFDEKIDPGDHLFIKNEKDDSYCYVSSSDSENNDISSIAKKNKNSIIVSDVIHDNITQQEKYINDLSYNNDSYIRILNDKYIIDNKLSDNIIKFIENILNKNDDSTKIEKWGENSNVNCKYINSEYIQNNNIDLFNKINMIFTKIASEIISNYSEHGFFHNNSFTLRKIYGPTRKHSDGVYNNNDQKSEARYASCIISLNDDYEGGEFIFEKQQFNYKLKKNDIICFPPYYTHPHATAPLKNMTYRYTINTWFLVK